MKTIAHIRKTIIASAIAIVTFAALSLQANAQCQAGFTFTVNTNTVTFTNTSSGTGNPTYMWNFGDSNYDWQTNPVHTYLSNGIYTACVTMYDSLNNGCQSSYCDTIVITGAPNPPCSAYFTYSDSMNTNGTQFYDLSSSNPQSWFWNFGDGTTSTLQNPTHQYAQTGYYMACLTIVDASSDTCTYCDTISYFPCTLSVGFTFNTSADPLVAFTNTTTGGYSPSYSWNFGDGTYASSTNATHTYSFSGTYMVCLTAYDSLNNCSDTYCDTLNIVNAPFQPCVAQFYAYPDSNNTTPGMVYFYDYSTGGATAWAWTFGDGGTSTQQHPTHQYASPGTYWVCLTVTTPHSTCSTCDSVQYKIFGAGVHENVNVVSNMQNYPNPFYNKTTISYTLDKNSNVNIAVYDRIGSKVAEIENSEKSAGQHQLEWNAENLPAGIYHLQLTSGGVVTSRKLVLVR
jgi:PKD repeat protein